MNNNLYEPKKDGASCHTTKANMRYLNKEFEGRVVSRFQWGGIWRYPRVNENGDWEEADLEGFQWSAMSPDLSWCDYWLWVWLENNVGGI